LNFSRLSDCAFYQNSEEIPLDDLEIPPLGNEGWVFWLCDGMINIYQSQNDQPGDQIFNPETSPEMRRDKGNVV